MGRLGTSYWALSGEPQETLDLTLANNADTEWGLVVVQGGAATHTRGHTLSITLESDAATIGVVNLGPADLDADDDLVSATFTLGVETTSGGVGGCGCVTGTFSGGLAFWLALALVGFRRREITDS